MCRRALPICDNTKSGRIGSEKLRTGWSKSIAHLNMLGKQKHMYNCNDAIGGVSICSQQHSNFHSRLMYKALLVLKFSHSCNSNAAQSTPQGGIRPQRSGSDHLCADRRPTILPLHPGIACPLPPNYRRSCALQVSWNGCPPEH